MIQIQMMSPGLANVIHVALAFLGCALLCGWRHRVLVGEQVREGREARSAIAAAPMGEAIVLALTELHRGAPERVGPDQAGFSGAEIKYVIAQACAQSGSPPRSDDDYEAAMVRLIEDETVVRHGRDAKLCAPVVGRRTGAVR